jgi:hypothetical protein
MSRIRFLIFQTAICIAMSATTAAAQSDSFDGVYKPIGAEFGTWDCKAVGQDGGAVAIQDGKLLGVEMTCALKSPSPVDGMSAILFDAECAGEGYEWTEPVMLMDADFGIYYITDSFVAEWQSCEAP